MKKKILLALIISSLSINLAHSNQLFSLGVGYAHSSTYSPVVDNTDIAIPPLLFAYDNYLIPYVGLGGDVTLAKYGRQLLYTIRARITGNFAIPSVPISIYGGANTGIAFASHDRQIDKYGISYSFFLGTRVYIVPSLFFVFLEGGYPYPNVMGGIGLDI